MYIVCSEDVQFTSCVYGVVQKMSRIWIFYVCLIFFPPGCIWEKGINYFMTEVPIPYPLSCPYFKNTFFTEHLRTTTTGYAVVCGFLFLFLHISVFIWHEIKNDIVDKIFKNGPSKICGRQPLKSFTWSIIEYFVP